MKTYSKISTQWRNVSIFISSKSHFPEFSFPYSSTLGMANRQICSRFESQKRSSSRSILKIWRGGQDTITKACTRPRWSVGSPCRPGAAARCASPSTPRNLPLSFSDSWDRHLCNSMVKVTGFFFYVKQIAIVTGSKEQMWVPVWPPRF